MKASISLEFHYILSEQEQLKLEVLIAFIEDQIEKTPIDKSTVSLLEEIITNFKESRKHAESASEVFVKSRD